MCSIADQDLLFLVDNKVRQLIDADVVEHPIICAPCRRRKLSHFQMDLRNEWVKADFVMAASFILPFKIRKQRRNYKASFHHFFHNVPACTKYLRFWF